MRNYVFFIFLIVILFIMTGVVNANTESIHTPKLYMMPKEDSEHEGTWIQWPHNFTYGKGYKENLQSIWVQMTKSLSLGEIVHIITFDYKEMDQIKTILKKENVDLNKVDFYVYPTDDVWIRDNGPIFVYNKDNDMVMLNWGFNGWGKKTPYKKCAKIPKCISKDLNITRIDLTNIVLEGGALEFDGNGTCITTRSSVINNNRNPQFTEKQIEDNIKKYYGVNQVIWLDGIKGKDITDFHIDGFVKFLNDTTVITMEKNDLLYWGLNYADLDCLYNIKNNSNIAYNRIYLPLTKKNVVLKDGKNLGYKGSYINFYIANDVILVPNYNDANDEKANDIIQKLYPTRKVVGIDVRELYKEGGMIHCVTQQQPIDKYNLINYNEKIRT